MHTFRQSPCQLWAEREAGHRARIWVLLDTPLAPEVVAQLMALHRVRAPQTSRTGARRARASRPAAQANARSPKREEKELKKGVGHNRLEMG